MTAVPSHNPKDTMSSDLRTRLERLPAAALSDGMGKRGVLGPGLHRISGSGRVCGTAVTARCTLGCSDALLAAVAEVQPGQVLVARTPGEAAYFGGVMATECVRRGMAAVVIDGLVRDVAEIRALSLSVYARGTTPGGARLGAPGEIQVPLAVGQTVVMPGDFIVADDDGIVAVAHDDADAHAESAERIVALELSVVEAIGAGTSLHEAVERATSTLGR